MLFWIGELGERGIGIYLTQDNTKSTLYIIRTYGAKASSVRLLIISVDISALFCWCLAFCFSQSAVVFICISECVFFFSFVYNGETLCAKGE